MYNPVSPLFDDVCGMNSITAIFRPISYQIDENPWDDSALARFDDGIRTTNITTDNRGVGQDGNVTEIIKFRKVFGL